MSVAMWLGNQEAPRSILASGTSFREDLVMKIFLWPFSLFPLVKKSICQLMAKRCGNLPRGGLPSKSVNRLTDRPDMTSCQLLHCCWSITSLPISRCIHMEKS